MILQLGSLDIWLPTHTNYRHHPAKSSIRKCQWYFRFESEKRMVENRETTEQLSKTNWSEIRKNMDWINLKKWTHCALCFQLGLKLLTAKCAWYDCNHFPRATTFYITFAMFLSIQNWKPCFLPTSSLHQLSQSVSLLIYDDDKAAGSLPVYCLQRTTTLVTIFRNFLYSLNTP